MGARLLCVGEQLGVVWFGMANTVDDVLSGPGISGARELRGEFHFKVGKLTPGVVVRLWRHIGVEGVFFELSHFMKTPSQADPYVTSGPWGDDEASALRKAVMTLTMYFDIAVREGHTPDDTWLVPSRSFGR